MFGLSKKQYESAEDVVIDVVARKVYDYEVDTSIGAKVHCQYVESGTILGSVMDGEEEVFVFKAPLAYDKHGNVEYSIGTMDLESLMIYNHPRKGRA